MDVYYRLPADEVDSFDKVKQALLINFQLTEEGFRQKLFSSKAQQIRECSPVLYSFGRLHGQMANLSKMYEEL